MKKHKKKQIGIFVAVMVVFLIVPLVAYAVMYYSEVRNNAFSPASANVQLKEDKNKPEDKHRGTYKFELSQNGNYQIDKTVSVYDERGKNDEYLKVMLIPGWYDIEGNVCANIGTITDFRTKSLNDMETALEVKNSYDEVILTYILDDYWQESWQYNQSDGCFYYNGLIKSNSTTAPLIKGVEITSSVYEESKDYILHIDVLADAVQQYGGAVERRNWKD